MAKIRSDLQFDTFGQEGALGLPFLGIIQPKETFHGSNDQSGGKQEPKKCAVYEQGAAAEILLQKQVLPLVILQDDFAAPHLGNGLTTVVNDARVGDKVHF